MIFIFAFVCVKPYYVVTLTAISLGAVTDLTTILFHRVWAAANVSVSL